MSRYRGINKIFKVFLCGVFSLGFSLAVVTAAHAFSEMIVFGDSLSDSGNVYIATDHQIPGAPYYDGRFSNGFNYADDLASDLALSLEPSLGGGTNFAFGGALAENLLSGLPYDLGAQIDQFKLEVSTGAIDKPDKDALYIVFIGGNNLLDALGKALADPANAQTIVATAISDTVNNIHDALQSLKDAGAINILVPNLPNIGRTPEMVQKNATPLGTQVTTTFNTQLDAMLNTLTGVNIIPFDTYSLLEDIIANPSAYGFNNVDSACYTGSYSGGGNVCADPNAHLFWDQIHPSAKTHQILANHILTDLLDNFWSNAGAVDLGNGWRWLDWFGYFNVEHAPWIYHAQLGWLYQYGTNTDNLVFYDPQMKAFWWTSQQEYPYLYRFSDQAWLWYLQGSQDPSWFYNFKTSKWESY